MSFIGIIKALANLPSSIYSIFVNTDYNYLDRVIEEGLNLKDVKVKHYSIEDIKKLLNLKLSKNEEEEFKVYYKLINDIINSKEFQAAGSNIQHHNKVLFNHLLKVSYKSFKYTYRKGLNYKATTIGALLHDFFIYDRYHKPNKLKKYNHGLIHGYIAYKNALKYGLLKNCGDKELIKEIIVNHMWPFNKHPIKQFPKHKETWIVMMIDKYDALKEYLF